MTSLIKFIHKHQLLRNLQNKLKKYPHIYSAIYSFFVIFSPPLVKNGFYNYVIFHICAILRVLHFPPAYRPYRKIETLKDRYKGQRCFIIGNGPSLTVQDLEKIGDEIAIGANMLYLIYEKTNWRPMHYTFGEPNFFQMDETYRNSIPFEIFCKKEIFSTHPFRKVNIPTSICIPFCWLDHWYKKKK